MTAPQDDPDAVAVWLTVTPVGKGLRDQQRHAFGSRFVDVVCGMAEAGQDRTTIEIPTFCNQVVTFAELQGEGGAPCQLCLAVVPLQLVPAPKPPKLPQRVPGEHVQMVENHVTIAMLTIYVHGDQGGFCPACKDRPKAPCQRSLDAGRILQLLST